MTRPADLFSFDTVVTGPSPRMRAVFDAARLASTTDSPVVIVGEIGTGKELIARMIHEASPFKHGPFVAVRCEASELIHELACHGPSSSGLRESGSQGRDLFELAAGGTLLLDSIDHLPLEVQAGLARSLRDRRVTSAAAPSASPASGAHIIATSLHDLDWLVAEGRFDRDLQLQLSVVTIVIPALRERPEDILPLARHFLNAAAERKGQSAPVVPPQIEGALVRYGWPGNVRELENTCERMVDTCMCGTVRGACLAPEIVLDDHGAVAPYVPAHADERAEPLSVSLDDRLREVEAQLIAWALRASNGNKSRAAALLRIKRTTLADRITRHGPSLFVAAGLAAPADAERLAEARLS